MPDEIINIYHPDHGKREVTRGECNKRVLEGWFYTEESAKKKSRPKQSKSPKASKKYTTTEE